MKLLPFKIYKVHGTSMLPALAPGMLLVGWRWFGELKVGQAIVVKRTPVSLKRIIKINNNGIWVEGDNKDASTDSRNYGYIAASDIDAVIVRVIG